MDGTQIASLLSIAIQTATSVMFAALGGIVMERAGVLCLVTEGVMMMSAMVGVAGARLGGNEWSGAIAGMLVGSLFGLVYAFWVVTLRTNQVASGLGFAMLGSGFAVFLGRPIVGLAVPKFQRIPLPVASDIPVVGQALFHQDALAYALFILIVATYFCLFRTREGVHLRAVGENPQAAYALGVNVVLLRYAACLIGGMLIGLGGVHLSLAYTPGWSEGITSGRGWIAVAMVVFSSWHPLRVVIGALLFGGVTAMQFRMQAAGVTIQTFFLAMLPYAVTILTLFLVTRRGTARQAAPHALGIPFQRE